MAYGDPYEEGTQTGPTTGGTGMDDIFVNTLNGLYQQYYGRPATDGEIASHRGNPGGIAAIEAALRASQPAAPAPVVATPDPGPTPTPTPSPSPSPSPSPYTTPYASGSGGTGIGSWMPQTPVFTPPTYKPPPAFSYGDFTAPTGADVLNDPGYAFRRDQGQQQLMNSKAAAGTLNTGGTLKDFLNYNQNFASQEYGNVWDRKANEYSTNRNNAADTYRTNYDTQFRDPYEIAYKGALDSFAPQMEGFKINAQAGQRQSELDQEYSWKKYLDDYYRMQDQRNFKFDVTKA